MRISTLTPLLAVVPSALAAKPVKPPIGNSTNFPLHFGLVTFTQFQALDVFGPFDVLNSLALLFNVPLKLSVFAKTLDGVSTSPGKLPNNTHIDFGEAILPTITYADYLAGKGGDIDVLFIPGGGGTRQPLVEEIAFVKSVFPKVKWVLTVCTGATLVARSGYLDGRRATTNKLAWEWATSTGRKTHWIGKARWVDDGQLWSSSGVSAGSDMMYAWVGHVYGEEVADYLSKGAEYSRWLDADNDPFSEIWEAHDVEPVTV